MGCQQSTGVVSLRRMNTEKMLALPHTYVKSATRIRQDEIVDHVLSRPQSRQSSFGEKSVISHVTESFTTDGELFQDPTFPADLSSLGFEEPNEVSWMRPHQLCTEPRLFVDGVSRGDVKQGVLGDCWLLAACAAVATRQDLLERVIHPSQCLHGEKYKGLILLKFWRFGEQVEVCIDDRLPTRNGELIYASCTHPEEFWLPLLEKGFAKIYGNYAALEGGHAASALAELTGGIAERISTSNCSFESLETIFQHGAFVTCAGNKRSQGLVSNHAYTLTGVTKVKCRSGEDVNLLRLRSPWADSVEWEGSWSDGSEQWMAVEESEKANLNQKNSDDGEFWMNFEDFQDLFLEITVATLGPDFDSDGCSDSPRQYIALRSQWLGKTAGGSRNNLEKFQENPQFLLTVQESNNQATYSFLIGLMQQPLEEALLPIAFFIYKTDAIDSPHRAEFFLCVQEEASSGIYTDCREVLARVSLSSSNYIIIPATFLAGCDRQFLLRVYGLNPFTLRKLPSELRMNIIDDT